MSARPALDPLPIDALLPAISAALEQRASAVVVAAPGAGKTTRLPLALLDAPWRNDGRILVLEPRRVAARAAATQMASLHGEPVGERVGYRVRHESRVSARTRIEVVTEGILTRMLQDDPALEGVAAVCFDEFHERHLPSDLGLALTLESRAVLRPDLRLVVMSATMDPTPVARLLVAADEPAAPTIASEGRAFPVTTEWRPLPQRIPMAAATAAEIRRALATHPGDALVFLPGIGEITRVRSALEEQSLDAEVQVLHGSLRLEEQDAVLRHTRRTRRVVLSTSIAESSVTLSGVQIVIDSGLSRLPRFDPRSGMTRLETLRVSRDSADQRRGRAGRTAPGHCVRLWDEATEHALATRSRPEILESDLAPLALELACAGVQDAEALRWLDAPPAGALAQARGLLRELAALDANGRVTAHGRAMARLGITPRLAHLALVGTSLGHATLACELAALLADRDLLSPQSAADDVAVLTRVEALRGRHPSLADRTRVQRVRTEARALQRLVSNAATERRAANAAKADLPRDDDSDRSADTSALGELVALAYPDRIAQRRPGIAARFLLRNGRGAKVEGSDRLGDEEYLAVADLDGRALESKIWLAAPISEASIRELFASDITSIREVGWNDELDRPLAVERETLGAIVLRERELRDAPTDEIAAAFLASVRRRGLDALPWRDVDRALRQRLTAAHAAAPAEWPDVSDTALLAELEQWLLPALGEPRRRADLERLRLADALLSMLDWKARTRLDEFVPTHLQVPSGSRIALDYDDPQAPVLAVKLQETFGWTDTPRVADGRLPVTLHLLSPAGRPVQVTKDLASFWRSGYFEVRKDLKGRYPRHPWPDDPLSATATRRVKPRGQ